MFHQQDLKLIPVGPVCSTTKAFAQCTAEQSKSTEQNFAAAAFSCFPSGKKLQQQRSNQSWADS